MNPKMGKLRLQENNSSKPNSGQEKPCLQLKEEEVRGWGGRTHEKNKLRGEPCAPGTGSYDKGIPYKMEAGRHPGIP